MQKIHSIKKPDRKIKLRPKLPRLSVIMSGDLISAAIFTILSVWLLVWRLGAQTSGLASRSELTTWQNLSLYGPWWKSLSHIYGPYYLLLNAFSYLGHTATLLRLTSVLIGAVVVFGVYWLIRELHGWRIALLAGSILITNYGFLALARQINPQITQLLAVTAAILAVYIINTWDNYWTLLVFFVVIGFSLYVPGGIWLAIAAVWLSFNDIKDSLKATSIKLKTLLFIILALILTPITYRLSFSYSNHQLLNWLGYNLSGRLSAVRDFGLNLIRSLLDLFAYGTKLPSDLAVKHLPMLTIAASVIILIGLLSYLSRLSNPKWRLITIFIVLGWILSGFGVMTAYALLPLLTIAAGTGLTYLLKQWYDVFPRNPFARYFGLTLMFLVIIFSGFLAARTYFVVWPNDPGVNSNYTNRL